MRYLFFAALVCICLSCASNKNGEAKDYNIAGTAWKLTEVNGKKVTDYPPQNREPYLRLSPEVNTAEGTGGCNATNTNYAIDGPNQIRFFRILSTKMACPDMTLESDFQLALDRSKGYILEKNELAFTDAQNKIILKFEAKE